MSDPVETSELVAFTKTIDAKSLSRAAAELGVPRATVSRRLARLEERLGARLLRRTTRSLVLTDIGEVFYRQACIALEAVRLAEQSVRMTDDVVRGDLRVSVPPMANVSLNAMLCEFAARYPALRVHVHASSQHVDILHGGYDVALRASSQIQPGLIARTLFRDPVIAVAAPAYLADHGTPCTQHDLRTHRCLLGFARGELPQSHWPLVSGGKIHVDGAFFSNDIALLCEAAVSGLGIALLPRNLVSPHLESGALVQVLAGAVGAEMQIALVYPERTFLPPQVRAFIDAVAAWVARDLAAKQRTSQRELSGVLTEAMKAAPRSSSKRGPRA
ncbi:LysR family transcriptional regulator [Burkholderia cenocepacia]|uniref:LysR family transcriptional regulator n=1 Tax=Burkholderia cenocepacia TaxID=95486 RepID=UPI0022300BA2|nr:LysR family transcriptional regulator [Burkholderia cenocepacia]MCW3610616.1 LysR family transcriptional regulator [Burkholderia cenocepacia]MCW5191723.1 LysR family transcriptional regulator [Burkholderia cenocepacia]